MIRAPSPSLRMLALAAMLAGCAQTTTGPDTMPRHGGPGYGQGGPMGMPAAPASASAGSSAAGATGTPEQRQAMCDLNGRMMAARTPEERQALQERYMQGMSPEMRERHMEMMRERCR
ncbi:MAG TPA: hypothetical protein VJ752_23280 [Burkholderiaceae bacterium]|nr:hypothetical protein [Burkholderiaceae bacterium]